LKYVRYLGKNGTQEDRDQANRAGVVGGRIYRVFSEIHHSWETTIRLEGIPLILNSVLFEVVEVKSYPPDAEEARFYGNEHEKKTNE
jgi:hypothetical protein